MGFDDTESKHETKVNTDTYFHYWECSPEIGDFVVNGESWLFVVVFVVSEIFLRSGPASSKLKYCGGCGCAYGRIT